MKDEGDDDEFKKVVVQSIESHREAYNRDKALDMFLLKVQDYREKENFNEVLDSEIQKLSSFFEKGEL